MRFFFSSKTLIEAKNLCYGIVQKIEHCIGWKLHGKKVCMKWVNAIALLWFRPSEVNIKRNVSSSDWHSGSGKFKTSYCARWNKNIKIEIWFFQSSGHNFTIKSNRFVMCKCVMYYRISAYFNGILYTYVLKKRFGGQNKGFIELYFCFRFIFEKFS